MNAACGSIRTENAHANIDGISANKTLRVGIKKHKKNNWKFIGTLLTSSRKNAILFP
jgi:hypothetical protein